LFHIIIEQEHFASTNKICCIYAYYEKDDLYKTNLKFFLDNGILEHVDYYIIVNGECTVPIPKKDNIKVWHRGNTGFDFGAYSFALNKMTDEFYSYYFFMNTSVCGPYLKDSSKPWTDHFLELFNKDTKLVGTSINIYPKTFIHGVSLSLTDIYQKPGPYTHVQSMFFCLDYEALQFLNKLDFFNESELNKMTNIQQVIAYKELGLSQLLIKNNWNINCILPKYKNHDYRTLDHDINTTSHFGDPYSKDKYFGGTIDKYEAIFYKTNRYMT
jgi:hypothetical protein